MGFLFGGDQADKINQGSFTDPNAEANKRLLEQQRLALTGQAAPQAQAATMDMGQQDQSRSTQMGVVDALQKQALGQAPSVAETALGRATDRGVAQQYAMAAGAHGGNPMLAMRAAMGNQVGIQQDAAGQMAQARIQEQQNAVANLGNVAGQIRGQDIGAAGTQAGFQQQTNIANLQTNAALQQQHNDLTQKYLAMGLNLDQAQFQAQQDLQKLMSGAYNADADRTGKGVGAILGAVGTAASGGIFGGGGK